MLQHKPLALPMHPVPLEATRFIHIGSYFAAEGSTPVDATWTGAEVAEDLTRQLVPWARRSVLEASA